MPRLYLVTSGFYTVSSADGATDLLQIKAGASNGFVLHQLVVTQSTDYGDIQAEGLQLTIKRGYGTITEGNPGSFNATVIPYSTSGDAADSLDHHERGNTTQASAGSGTLQTIWEEAYNVQVGFQFTPTPDLRPAFGPAEYLIVSQSQVNDTITLCACAILEER